MNTISYFVDLAYKKRLLQNTKGAYRMATISGANILKRSQVHVLKSLAAIYLKIR